jgi:4-amino-4-deoxy-L-arabinose transferase-like glycosyltransferase
VRLDKRRFLYVLGGITLAGLLLRLYIGWQLMQVDPLVKSPATTTDMATYLENARAVLAGAYDYSEGFYYQPFYYAVFLPAIFKVFGIGASGVIIVQSLLGAACIWLAGLAAARLFGKRTGICAAVILALSRMHIFYTPYMLMAVVQSFWVMLLFYTSVAACRRRKWWYWAVVGVVAGFSVITRGNMIFFVPLIGFLALWVHRRRKRLAVAAVAVLAAAAYLPQLPFAIVNYQAHGSWVGASSAAASVLALGNTPESPPGGREPWMLAGPMEYPLSYGEWNRQAKLPEGEGGISLLENTWRWFSREPLAYLELKGRMVLLFWNRVEVPNNVSIISGRPSPVHRLLQSPVFFGFAIFGSLAVAGMILALMNRRRRMLLWYGVGFVTLYCASIVLFYVLARFRLPLVPVLCVFAGYPVGLLWGHWRRPQRQKVDRRPLAYRLGVTALAFLLVCVGFDLYSIGWESTVLRIVRPNGVEVVLPDRVIVKDHGPLSFGGWTSYPIRSELTVEKTFALSAIPVDAATWRVRLALGLASVSSGELPSIKVNSQTLTAVPDGQGIGWVTYPLRAADFLMLDERTLRVRLLCSPATSPGVALVFDTKRKYGRTECASEVPDGELVIELVADQ